MSSNDLRRVIRAIIQEAAVSSAQAAQSLALYRKSNGGGVVYVLYDPVAFAKELPAWEDASSDPARAIYGYLDVRPHQSECWGAAEVKFSAAQKGYGPLMYALAMADFEGGIMSDRNSTSDAARNVWKRYNQRADVEKKPFDDKKAPKTPPKVDDCKMIPDFDGEEAYLNQAYRGKGDAAGKPAMMQRHKETVASVAAQTGKQPAEVEQAVYMMGDEYFGTRYRDG